MSDLLTERQRTILNFIESSLTANGYPPSVREIGEAVGLTSPSTVHNHLSTLERKGFLRRDPTKPRAMEIRYDRSSTTPIERRPLSHVPLIGTVAAGTGVLAQEHIEDVFSLPTDFTGSGELFMLTVRGDSMIEKGIYDGDYAVVRQQPTAEYGDLVVAGILEEEATIKTYLPEGEFITLLPANALYEPLIYPANEVIIFGKVVTIIRRF
jgi:repressor LexA